MDDHVDTVVERDELGIGDDAATSMSASRVRSRPVISQSIQTSLCVARSVTA